MTNSPQSTPYYDANTQKLIIEIETCSNRIRAKVLKWETYETLTVPDLKRLEMIETIRSIARNWTPKDIRDMLEKIHQLENLLSWAPAWVFEDYSAMLAHSDGLFVNNTIAKILEKQA